MPNLKGTLKCPICMEKFDATMRTTIQNNKEGDIPVAKSCGHVFHRACINKSVQTLKQTTREAQKTCPICAFSNMAYNVTLKFGSQMAYVNEERAKRPPMPKVNTTTSGVPPPKAPPASSKPSTLRTPAQQAAPKVHGRPVLFAPKGAKTATSGRPLPPALKVKVSNLQKNSGCGIQ